MNVATGMYFIYGRFSSFSLHFYSCFRLFSSVSWHFVSILYVDQCLLCPFAQVRLLKKASHLCSHCSSHQFIFAVIFASIGTFRWFIYIRGRMDKYSSSKNRTKSTKSASSFIGKLLTVYNFPYPTAFHEIETCHIICSLLSNCCWASSYPTVWDLKHW